MPKVITTGQVNNVNAFLFLKKLNLILLCGFYLLAGINHFWHPDAYLDLIPPYLPNHYLLNIISGVVEISGGILMIIPFTRRIAAYLLIALLIAFIPAHIYLIQQKGCISKYLCVAEWIAWIRLIPFQLILMWWVWKTYKWNKNILR